MRASQTAPSRYESLVDDTVVAYVEWREECVAVWEAYGRWTSTPEDKAPAHAAYQAALDREEAAANAYAKLVERVGHLVETSLEHPLVRRGSR